MLPILLEYMECGYSTTILGEVSNGLTSSAIQLHPEINETLTHCQPFFLSRHSQCFLQGKDLSGRYGWCF
jgi:hypothetical protein